MADKTIWALAAVVLMMGWGGYLRFHALGEQSFWIDESVSVLQCRGIWAHGTPRLPDGQTNWDGFPAAYPQALGLALGGADAHRAIRAPSAVAGIMAIALAYWVVWQATGSMLSALLAAGLIAFLPDQILWSRQARPYIFVQLYALISLSTFYRWRATRGPGWLSAALLGALLAAFSHRSGYLAPLVLGLLVLLDSGYPFRRKLVWGTAMLAGLWLLSMLVPVSNSALAATLRDLLVPTDTRYAVPYAQYLLGEYQWLLLFLPLALIRPGWRINVLAVALFLAAAVFFWAIAYRTWLYAHRYVFVLSPVVALLFGMGAGQVLQAVRARHQLVFIGTVLALTVALGFGPLTFRARAIHDPGYTAPTPPWGEAFALIAERYQRTHPDQTVPLRIISAFPALTDIYVMDMPLEKYYVPINVSGHPSDVWGAPPFTEAAVIESSESLPELKGYALFDDFSLRMIADPSTREYFLTTAPNAIIRARYPIYVWIVDN